MSFRLLAGGRSIDLGPTLEVLRAFSHFGQLEPTREFGYLHGVLHHEGVDFSIEDWQLVRRDAARFLKAHGSELDGFERSVLKTLATS